MDINIEDCAMSLKEVVDCFDNPKFLGSGYMVSCPMTERHNNGDKKQSLGISEAADGTILMNCLGCNSKNEEILDRVGLRFWGSDIVTVADFERLRDSKKSKRSNKKSAVKSKMPAASEKKHEKKPDTKEETPFFVYESVESGIKAKYSNFEYKCRYDYPNGAVKIRFWDPKARNGEGDKTFRWFYPIENGYANHKPKGYTDVLWINGPWHKENEKIIIDDPTVILVEGEKDCETVNKVFSLTAVSTASGGETWKKEYTEQLTGKAVYIMSDYDKTGNTYVEKVCESLYGKAKAIYVIRLEELWPEIPDKGDITDMYEELKEEKTIALITDAMNNAEPYVQKTEAEKNGFPIKLHYGKYSVSEKGVQRIEYDDEGNAEYEPVCAHPIIPIQILRNVETGEERINIWYRVAGYERTIPVAGSELFSSQKIIALSDHGVSVSSTTAKSMVNFFRETVDDNVNVIPVQKSVSHMGWVEGNQFVPYGEDIVYDGDISFKAAVEAIHTKGDMETWKQETGACREYSKELRLIMAAAFASPTIEPLGAMIFFVHLWGTASGSGKTAALMVAASIFGDPQPGNNYVVSLNATPVSQERTAAVLRNIAFMGDEAQTVRTDSRGNKIFDVYKLSEGVSKSRSNVSRGLDRMSRWACTFITTGETPLLSDNDFAGAQNRMIEIQCVYGKKIIKDGFSTTNIMRENFGWAGREWIEYLQKDGVIDSIRQRVSDIMKVLVSEYGITDKQAQAGALIIAADEKAVNLFWPDEMPLGIDDIVVYLKTEEIVDTGQRAYDFICSWIAQNNHKFINENNLDATEMGPRKLETYGVIERPDIKTGIVWANVIKKEFDTACGEGGFNSRALLAWLKPKKKIMTEREGVWTYKKKVCGKSVNVVRMALPKENKDLEQAEFVPLEDVLKFSENAEELEEDGDF